MFQAIHFLLVLFPLSAAIAPWNKVALVEVPAHRCLALDDQRSRYLCVSDSHRLEGDFTYLSEVRFSSSGVEKRGILKLQDTSTSCRGPLQSVSKFFGFESRDVDQDGRLDAVVLVRAGKLKRRGLSDGVCSPEVIATAIYEVSFRNTENGLEAYEPSYPVMQRLQSMAAVPAE